MRDIMIVTDSASDILKDCKHVKVLPYAISFKGEPNTIYSDDGKYSSRVFYDYVGLGVQSKVISLNPSDICNVLNEAASNKMDVIIIYSSGTLHFESEILLKDIVLDTSYRNIEMRIALIDSGSISLGEGLLVYKANQMLEAGYEFDSIAGYIANNKKYYDLRVINPNYDYMVERNNISPLQNKYFKLTHEVPCMGFSRLGSLKVVGAYQSQNLYENFVNDILKRIKDKNQTFGVVHSRNLNDANMVKDLIQGSIPDAHVLVREMQFASGSEFGKGAVGIAYKRN